MNELHQDEAVRRINLRLPENLAVAIRDIQAWTYDSRFKLIPDQMKVPGQGAYWYDKVVDQVVRIRTLQSYGLKIPEVKSILALEAKKGLLAVLCRDCGSHVGAFSSKLVNDAVCSSCEKGVTYIHRA